MVGGLGWYIAKKISSVQARLIKKKKKKCAQEKFYKFLHIFLAGKLRSKRKIFLQICHHLVGRYFRQYLLVQIVEVYHFVAEVVVPRPP